MVQLLHKGTDQVRADGLYQSITFFLFLISDF